MYRNKVYYMENNIKNIIVIIPSLNPGKDLVSYVSDLIRLGFTSVIVVNDGSGEECSQIFDKLSKMKECKILIHSANMGKGTALKTGYRYVREHLTDLKGIVTVDADGQHDVEDVKKLAGCLLAGSGGLYLGCRDFKRKSLPVKSVLGNRSVSFLFFFLYGTWLSDTQTGLRAFDTSLLDRMLKIPGSRFEYEMQVLIHCVKMGIPVRTIEIRTIYENNNKGSHYKWLSDSGRIIKILLQNKWSCGTRKRGRHYG